MPDPEEMPQELLTAIRARLDEPPPLIALAERNRGRTPLAEYLRRLQEDRIALVDEVDRLRAELAGGAQSNAATPQPDSRKPPRVQSQEPGAVPGAPVGGEDLEPDGAATQLLRIHIEERPGYGCLKLTGELDMSNCRDLQEALAKVETASPSQVTVDLSSLGFIDSSGLHVLLEARRRAVAHNRRLTLIPGPPAVRAAFQITSLDNFFDFGGNNQAE